MILTNIEFYDLMQQISEFLTEKISLKVKYKITVWVEKHSPLIKPYTEIRNTELKNILGDKTYLPNKLEDGSNNPEYIKFIEVMKPIDMEKVEIPDFGDKLSSDFLDSIISEKNYPILYKNIFINS